MGRGSVEHNYEKHGADTFVFYPRLETSCSVDCCHILNIVNWKDDAIA